MQPLVPVLVRFSAYICRLLCSTHHDENNNCCPYASGSHTPDLQFHSQDPPAAVVELKEESSDRATRQYELDNMQGIEDTSILEDLAEAEEGYDKPDQVQFPAVTQLA